MAITEKQRHQLFTKVEEVFGPDEAATMMELMAPMAWREIAKAADLALVKGDVDVLRADVAELKVDVAGIRVEMATFRVEMERQSSRTTRSFVTWLLASQSTVVLLMVFIATIGR